MDLFHRDGAQAVAAAVDTYAKTLPRDQVVLLVDPQKQRVAGNLPRWPAGVPDAPGTYGLVIDVGDNASTRVIVSHVSLPGGYVLMMGRESVIFDSLVARFWLGVAGAIAILLSLGLLFGWLLRRAHGQLERLVERRTAALQLSEERYSLAMEASEEGHFDIRYDIQEQFYSDRLLEMVGIPAGTHFPSRAEALKVLRFFSARDQELYLATIRSVEARNGPNRYEFEFRILLPSGEMRWLRTRAKIARDSEGNIQRRTGVAADITARKCAEEGLRLSEERYARAMEGSDAGHWEWNIVSDEMFVSERAREMLALPPGELPMRRSEILELVPAHPDDRTALTELVNAALRSNILAHDYRIIPAPGQVRWLRVRAKVYHDARGAAVRMTGSLIDITERRAAEEAVRESEKRFRGLTELSNDFFWETDTEHRYTTLEHGLVHRGEHQRWKKLGRRPWDIPYTSPDEAAWAAHRTTIAARKQFIDFAMSRVDRGEERFYEISGEPRFDADGTFLGYRGVGRETTARVRAEQAFRQSQESYALAMDATGAGHWDWKIPTDEFYASPRHLEIGGFAPDAKFAGRAEFAERYPFHPEDRPKWQAVIDAHFAGTTPRIDIEIRILPRGELRWVRMIGQLQRDHLGRPLRYAGVSIDTTEAKLAEEALRLSEERYGLAMEASEEGHWDWNVRTDEIFISAHIKKLFGFPLDAEFRTRSDLVARVPYHPDDRSWLLASLGETLAGTATTHEFEYRIVRGGEIHWLQARWKILRDATGAAQRVIGVITDVTERKRAEEELKEMERKLRQAQRLEAMGTLAGGIAHDFNNILGAILGFSEMAMQNAAKRSRVWRDLDCIVEAGERGRALVDRVLAFSRSSVGERVPVHVERVVREALEQLSAKLPANITLHAKLHAGRAAMQGDATQVHQVVMNLVTNAMQAMGEGGTLRVSLGIERIEQAYAPTIGTLAPAEYLVLRVADTGTGIPADVLEHMFDPFFTTKEVGTGTGLGLSIVHGIVTELGGAIDVATTVSAGSTFTIYLPRAGDAVEADRDEKLAPPRGDGQRVLVVDDEEPLVRLATRTLEQLGYTPVGFTSSRAALAAFRADPGRFDAVITDERMPGMSGSVLIRKVRSIRDGIPVVLMSGHVGDAVARQAREAGAGEVLRKPLSARDLATSLARVLYS